MDTVVLSDEEWNAESYKSLYMRAVDTLRETLDPAWGPLATRWFAYDRLALVRTQACTLSFRGKFFHISTVFRVIRHVARAICSLDVCHSSKLSQK